MNKKLLLVMLAVLGVLMIVLSGCNNKGIGAGQAITQPCVDKGYNKLNSFSPTWSGLVTLTPADLSANSCLKRLNDVSPILKIYVANGKLFTYSCEALYNGIPIIKRTDKSSKAVLYQLGYRNTNQIAYIDLNGKNVCPIFSTGNSNYIGGQSAYVNGFTTINDTRKCVDEGISTKKLARGYKIDSIYSCDLDLAAPVVPEVVPDVTVLCSDTSNPVNTDSCAKQLGSISGKPMKCGMMKDISGKYVPVCDQVCTAGEAVTWCADKGNYKNVCASDGLGYKGIEPANGCPSGTTCDVGQGRCVVQIVNATCNKIGNPYGCSIPPFTKDSSNASYCGLLGIKEYVSKGYENVSFNCCTLENWGWSCDIFGQLPVINQTNTPTIVNQTNITTVVNQTNTTTTNQTNTTNINQTNTTSLSCTPGPTGKIKCTQEGGYVYSVKEYQQTDCSLNLATSYPDKNYCGYNDNSTCQNNVGCCGLESTIPVCNGNLLTNSTKNKCTGEIKEYITNCSSQLSYISGEKNNVCGTRLYDWGNYTKCYESCTPGNKIVKCDLYSAYSYYNTYVCDKSGLDYNWDSSLQGCPSGQTCKLFNQYSGICG